MSNRGKNIISFFVGFVLALVAYCLCIIYNNNTAIIDMNDSDMAAISGIIFIGGFAVTRVIFSNSGGDDGGLYGSDQVTF